MAQPKSDTVFVKGTLYWPKIVGDQALHANYDGDGREWSYELEPNDAEFLKEHGLLDRLKDPMDYVRRLEKKGETEKAEAAALAAKGRGDYLVLRKPEFTKAGDKNDPIRIYDSDNEPWGEDRLIGNGTKADVKLRIVDYGRGKKSGIYTTAIRITELVPYVSNEFGAMDGETAVAPKTRAKKPKTKVEDQGLDDLDDDIPF